MSNEYHLLSFWPHHKKNELYVEQEALAKRLVEGNFLHIADDNRRNFALFKIAQDNISMVFHRRELTVKKRVQRTKRIIRDLIENASFRDPSIPLDREVDIQFGILTNRVKKYIAISKEREMEVARLLVQSAHPAVVELLLLERVKIFVSFAHSISELLDIRDWVDSRDSGGMQMVRNGRATVFISAGGDPFITEEEYKTYTTDGFPAMARLLVIAAQEFGHFADMIRDKQGRYVSRHSMTQNERAKENVAKARKADIERVRVIRGELKNIGLSRIIAYERRIQFNARHNKSSWWLRFFYNAAKNRFVRKALNTNLRYVEQFPMRLFGSEWLGANLANSLDDMAFNLAPEAMAYQREDPKAEEAIACAEALARVPQQAVKWGRATVKNAWPGLYRIYYGEVIADCMAEVERITGKPYQLSYTKPRNGIVQKLFR